MLRRARFIRWVLMCLVFALPLQAWSAAAMRCCAHAPATPAQQPVHAGLSMSAQAQPCDGPQQHVHSCSACAACCLGLALIPSVPVAAAPEAAPQPLPDVVTDVARAAHEAPERPPRRSIRV